MSHRRSFSMLMPVPCSYHHVWATILCFLSLLSPSVFSESAMHYVLASMPSLLSSHHQFSQHQILTSACVCINIRRFSRFHRILMIKDQHSNLWAECIQDSPIRVRFYFPLYKKCTEVGTPQTEAETSLDNSFRCVLRVGDYMYQRV